MLIQTSMRRESDSLSPAREHGSHTLKVFSGTVVGVYGNDVFVELGARMQGVIAADHFAARPAVGEVFEFTLRGREDGLWALALREEQVLTTWENLELGSWVQARAVRAAFGGLEMKVGPLHAFLPKSHSGLARDERIEVLVGKQFTCEVIEIESQRQRVVLSRKLVLQHERSHPHQRDIGSLRVGEIVQGTVTRVEDYGVFVAFGGGLEGMVHVSNLAYARDGSSPRWTPGQPIEAVVLAIRAGGRRIALGLKQLSRSPWEGLASRLAPGDLVQARVTRVMDFGVFVAIPGTAPAADGAGDARETQARIEGLLPAAECGLEPRQVPADLLRVGDVVSLRVLDIDEARERLRFSLRHPSGARIADYEAESRALALHDARFAAAGGRDGPTPGHANVAPPVGSLRDKLAAALRRSG